MKGSPAKWIRYAEENFDLAKYSAGRQFHMAAIQNAQQSAEKSLKAVCIAKGLPIKRTHSITALHRLLITVSFESTLSMEDCELLDSVYLPSKYPDSGEIVEEDKLEGVVRKCILLAERLLSLARSSSNAGTVDAVNTELPNHA